MDLLHALEKGVRGVLEGICLSVTVKTYKDKKTEEEKQLVIAKIGVPALFQNFDIFVPEQFVPDMIRDANVHLLPGIKVDKWNAPVLDMVIKEVF